MPLEYERAEPSSGADPDHRPYEGQVTAACDGVELLGKVSNLRCGAQNPEACRLADPALRAEGAIRTRKPRGLSSRGIPVPVTPASCAARDSNPEPAA